MTDKIYKGDVDIDFLQSNSISPNGLYYYETEPVVALNDSAFGCRVMIFETDRKKIVYDSDRAFCHELHTREQIEQWYSSHRSKIDLPRSSNLHNTQIEVVWWSKQGNMCYLLEYTPFKNRPDGYTSIFLDMSRRRIYRVDELINRFHLVDSLNLQNRNFDEEHLLRYFRG